MSADFVIQCEWTSGHDKRPEIAETTGLIEIRISSHCATKAHDHWSGTITEHPCLSAYPLALWLTVGWWRLLQETRPDKPDIEWRLTHEMASAGGGYNWPPLILESDGRQIKIAMNRSSDSNIDTLLYLGEFEVWLEPEVFEYGVQEFVRLVLARLTARGISDTPLHQVWSDLICERAEPKTVAWRQLEARLGFDADEAPFEIIQAFLALRDEAGRAAADEIAHDCAGRKISALSMIERLHYMAEHCEARARIGKIPSLEGKWREVRSPWSAGRVLAHELRTSFGFGASPIGSDPLCDLFGVSSDLFYAREGAPLAPISLGIREEYGHTIGLTLRRRTMTSRRFEVTRLLADWLSGDASDHWLPVTDAMTARQKKQRAFAAEFLCPLQGIQEYLEDDYSDEQIEQAAAHFMVSYQVVSHQLKNNHLIPVWR